MLGHISRDYQPSNSSAHQQTPFNHTVVLNIKMISIMQSSYFAEILDTAWSVPATDEKTLADTLVDPSEKDIEPTPYYPKRTSDNETESDCLMLEMLCSGVPQSVVRSILKASSYDIMAPEDTPTAPFLVISYADETNEDIRIAMDNTHPRQSSLFLQVPKPGMTAKDREEEIEEEKETEEDENDAWVRFGWSSSVDAEDYSSADRMSAANPDTGSHWPEITHELVTFEELSELGTGYFIGYGRRRGMKSTAGWLDMHASATERPTTIEPWKTVKYGSLRPMVTDLVEIKSRVEIKPVEDWSQDYEMGEEAVDMEEGENEMDVDKDQGENMDEDTESDLTELSEASQSEDEEMTAVDDEDSC